MSVLELSQVLGNFGEFIGAIAVVVTLIYLAVQIRQNTSSVRSQVALGMAQISQQSARMALEFGDLSLDDASSADQRQTLNFIARITSFENIYIQNREGAISDEIMDSRANRLWPLLRQHSDLWDEYHSYFAASFDEWVNSHRSDWSQEA